MTEDTKAPSADPAEMGRAAAELAERCQRVAQAFIERQGGENGFQIPDPLVIGRAFLELGARMMADPAKLIEAQAALMRDYAALWQATARRLAGEPAETVVEPAADDRRFRDRAWSEGLAFDVIKQSYLLTSRWLRQVVHDVEGLDAATARKVDFYTRQMVDALSPANFVMTNPQVLRATLDSGGENLAKGLEHLLADLEEGKGQLRISMTDAHAFRLGENVAASPGKVIFQNELMQLLQYAPLTETVHKRPLLIVPPWINKFYVLDLQPKNSFIRWATSEGHTVFVVSWVNPDERLAHKAFEDYMLEGPLAALAAIEEATGEREANVIGYCIGGTLLACALAYIAAAEDEKWQGRVKSATFFTAMVDFADAGELAVFIDEEQLALLEEHMKEKGYLEGRHMATVFNMMRDNDLIWSFVVNNYLMGRDPLPFDLLYWNSDSTRMPAMMHGFYLRKMYLENKLVEPGGIALAGVPIDLARIETPVYILATREDHIAPWKSTYAATRIYAGPVRFVLSASGHIAGVVNPPAAKKYCYWTNAKRARTPDGWLAGAARHDGSWWSDWAGWVRRHAGPRTAKARTPGAGRLAAIEDAPGSYVRVRADD